jgi:hypothetical protein
MLPVTTRILDLVEAPALLSVFVLVLFIVKLRRAKRRALARWLAGLPAKAKEQWPTVFQEMFDRLFLVRVCQIRQVGIGIPDPLRCFVISLLTVAFLFLVFIVVCGADVGLDLANEDGPLLRVGPRDGSAAFISISSLFLAPVVANFVIDYVSLCKTRFAIGVLRKAQGQGRSKFLHLPSAVAIVAVDATISVALVLFLFPLLAYGADLLDLTVIQPIIKFLLGIKMPGVATVFYTEHWSYMLSWSSLKYYWLGIGREGVFGIYVYSTFLTSVWMALFVFGSVIVRLLSVIARATNLANRYTHVTETLVRTPLRFVGYVLVVLIWLVLGASYIAWTLFS